MTKLKFKPLKSRLRATFSGNQLGSQRLGQIDEKGEILHDVQITLEGEAKGHGVWLDREFCEAVATQGNQNPDVGLKVRYGHPAMCSDAIGTELGRAKNFRVVDFDRTVDGETVKAAGVIADIAILASAHAAPQGDIARHVIETAKEDPGQFGQSIVFTYADWKVKDADGNNHFYKKEVDEPMAAWNKEHPDATIKEYRAKLNELEQAWWANSADGKVYAVLGKLHGTDFTDTPAATDGIFSTNTLAEEAERMFDEHPQILETLEKNPKSVVEFLTRTGLIDQIDSARVSGMQAAKDREIAALTTDRDQALAALDPLKTEVEQLKAKIATLTADRDQALAALDPLKTEVEQLKAKIANDSAELAAKQAALEQSEKRYREQVGLALKPAGDQFAGLSGRELAIAALQAKHNS